VKDHEQDNFDLARIARVKGAVRDGSRQSLHRHREPGRVWARETISQELSDGAERENRDGRCGAFGLEDLKKRV